MGRFCSADPLDGQPNDPQSWNRYAYVRNDPVNLTDPSGQGLLSFLIDFFVEMFLPEVAPAIFGQFAADAAVWAPDGLVTTTVGNSFNFGMFSSVTVTAGSVGWGAGALGAGLTAGAIAEGALAGAPQQPQTPKKPNPCNNQSAVNFVKAHQADASAVANKLNVPTENVLGLSAKESAWGTGRFAQEGNAFFNMEVKVPHIGDTPTSLAPFSNGSLQASGDPRVFVFTYANYLASAKSFAAAWGSAVQGIKDPRQFLTALRKAGFNTVDKGFTDPKTIDMTKARMNCP